MLALVLLVPILFNISGIIDTYLTKLFSKHQKSGNLTSSTGTLMIVWGIMALIIASILFCIFGMQVFTIWRQAILSIFIGGIFMGIAVYPYLEALKGEKIENIIPMLQTIPVFSYVLANIVLGESMSIWSIIIMIAVVGTTMLFSRDLQAKKYNRKGILLMLLSSLFYGLSYVSFKFWGESVDNVWISYFWEHIGIIVVDLFFFLQIKIRTSTFHYFKTQGVWFSLLNIGNEIFYLIGMVIVSYLVLHYNVAFIETISNGLQPILAFFMVFLAYKFLPDIYIRNYKKKELIGKLSLCIITFLLLFIFYRVS